MLRKQLDGSSSGCNYLLQLYNRGQSFADKVYPYRDMAKAADRSRTTPLTINVNL